MTTTINKKTLFKIDSKNKVRVWSIWNEEDMICQEAGLLDGKLVYNTKKATPKNIGRSSESSGEEQAIKEIESTYKQKFDEGYFTTVEEAKEIEIILPMLAKSYKDEKHKIDWEKDKIYVQPKFDGMRSLKKGEVLKSRDNKIIQNMQHIEKELLDLGEYHLDGELYVHGENFQTNMTYIKYREGLSEKIQYHIYDLISELPFEERIQILIDKIKESKNIVLVKTFRIYSEEELKEYHSKFLSEGYEGTMIRISKSGYKVNGRSSELLKYKDFLDIDCKIIDIGPAKQRPEWGRPVVEWNGKQFACGTKMSHEQRIDLLVNKDKYIGKMANIRYFEEYDGGIPRFPIFCGIHEDR